MSRIDRIKTRQRRAVNEIAELVAIAEVATEEVTKLRGVIDAAHVLVKQLVGFDGDEAGIIQELTELLHSAGDL